MTGILYSLGQALSNTVRSAVSDEFIDAWSVCSTSSRARQ